MTNYFLAIGFGEFTRKQDFKPLTSCRNNFKLIQSILSDAQHPIVLPQNVLPPLIDKKPSQVRDEISNLFAKGKTGDNIYIYITGHGINHINAQDLIIPSREANLDTIVSHSSYDAVSCLSLKSDISERKTNASTVNVVLDCCHAGASVGEISGDRELISKDAATNAFNDAVSSIATFTSRKNGASNVDKESRFTYLLGSDAAGFAYDVSIDFDEWEAGLYAENLKSIDLDADATFGRLALALYQISIAPRIFDSNIERYIGDKSTRNETLHRSACKLRDLCQGIRENDDGTVCLKAIEAPLATALAVGPCKQDVRLLDPHDVAQKVPVFYKSTISRIQKLGEIESFIRNDCMLFTSRTKKKIEDFLLTAKKKERSSRLASELNLEEDLFAALQDKDHAKFIETFILNDYENKLRSEVSAAVRRRTERTDKYGAYLSKVLDERNEEVKELKAELKNAKASQKETLENIKKIAERDLRNSERAAKRELENAQKSYYLELENVKREIERKEESLQEAKIATINANEKAKEEIKSTKHVATVDIQRIEANLNRSVWYWRWMSIILPTAMVVLFLVGRSYKVTFLFGP